MVSVAERQRIGRVRKGRHLFTGGAELTNQRILLAGNQQFRQIAGRGDVVDRQTRRFNIMRIGHPQRFGFRVHRADKGVIAARIVVRQASRRTVFRRHQRQQQHIFTADFTVQPHAGVDPLHLRRVADVHFQFFVQRQMCIKHHHRGH